MRKLITLTFFSLFSIISLRAQFLPIGDATQISERVYRLTSDAPSKFGGVWSKDKIDLGKSFEIVARMNFGSKNANGADGIAFTMGDNNSYLDKSAGSNFGSYGISPCISVEFDTYQSPGYNDPTFDHISIQKNSNYVHNFSNTLSGFVQMSSTNSNVEDGKEHAVRLNWNAVTKEFKVYFDCDLRLTYKADLKKDIYNNKDVYWGFTAGTGSGYNEQTVFIDRVSSLDDYNEKLVCTGQIANLHSSLGTAINWSPSADVSNPKIVNPTYVANKTNTFIATTNHVCNSVYKDTFKVIVPQLIPKKWQIDTAICEKQTLKINASAIDGKFYKWTDNSSDSTFLVKKPGIYNVTISDGNCAYEEQVKIDMNALPKVALGKDTSICDNQFLNYNVTNPNATYLWSDGSNFSQYAVNQTNTYWVKVTSDQNCVNSDTVKVTIRPTAKTNNIVKICEGDFYSFAGKKWNIDTTVCEVYAAKNACDSTHCVKIQLKPKIYFTVQKDICEGDFFEFNKKKYFKGGQYKDVLVAKNGCDSLVTINLNIIPIDTIKSKQFICENSSYSIGNQTIKNTGIYKIKLKDQQTGCDSIVVLDLKVIPLRGFSGKDTICEGEVLNFANQKLTKSGFYEVKLKNSFGCDSLVDMKLLVIATPKVKITTTKNSFCEGESTELVATSSATKEFSWSTGQAGEKIKASKSGTYKVFIEGTQGCKGFDTINVFQSPKMDFDLKIVSPTCSGYKDGMLNIEGITGGFPPYFAKLDLQKFGSKMDFSKLQEGTYNIVLKDSVGCEVEQKANLINPNPKSIYLNDKQRVMQLGDSTIAILNTSFSDIKNISWTPNEMTEKITQLETWLKPTSSTMFKISVEDKAGCILNDSLKVIVKDSVGVYVPNAFSANDDGVNDGLQVFVGIGVQKIIQFAIFDRWGNHVFDAQNYKPSEYKAWDGSFRNQQLEQGNYSYFVKYLKKNGKEEVKSGDFMMLR